MAQSCPGLHPKRKLEYIFSIRVTPLDADKAPVDLPLEPIHTTYDDVLEVEVEDESVTVTTSDAGEAHRGVRGDSVDLRGEDGEEDEGDVSGDDNDKIAMVRLSDAYELMQSIPI